MKGNLNLIMDETVVKQAKAYAKKQGISLSAVVESYLRTVTQKEKSIRENEGFLSIDKSLNEGDVSL